MTKQFRDLTPANRRTYMNGLMAAVEPLLPPDAACVLVIVGADGTAEFVTTLNQRHLAEALRKTADGVERTQGRN